MNHVAHRRRWLSLVFVISSTFILVVLSAGTFWGIAPRAQIRQGDEAFQQELEKAQSLLQKRKYDDALKSFKRANDLREKKCVECYVGMARAYQSLEAYKNVIESCDKGIELAGADTRISSLACNMKG